MEKTNPYQPTVSDDAHVASTTLEEGPWRDAEYLVIHRKHSNLARTDNLIIKGRRIRHGIIAPLVVVALLTVLGYAASYIYDVPNPIFRYPGYALLLCAFVLGLRTQIETIECRFPRSLQSTQNVRNQSSRVLAALILLFPVIPTIAIGMSWYEATNGLSPWIGNLVTIVCYLVGIACIAYVGWEGYCQLLSPPGTTIAKEEDGFVWVRNADVDYVRGRPLWKTPTNSSLFS